MVSFYKKNNFYNRGDKCVFCVFLLLLFSPLNLTHFFCLFHYRSSKRCEEDTDLRDLEDNDDVVFELTDEYVAVKVNYDDKMQSLRNRHAEDPMKEIAAMQLIRGKAPHVRCKMKKLQA